MGSRYKRYSINPQPPKKQAVFPRPMMANLGHPGFIASYPLVMTNSLPWNITMLSNHLFLWAIFHGELLNNQRVSIILHALINHGLIWVVYLCIHGKTGPLDDPSPRFSRQFFLRFSGTDTPNEILCFIIILPIKMANVHIVLRIGFRTTLKHT